MPRAPRDAAGNSLLVLDPSGVMYDAAGLPVASSPALVAHQAAASANGNDATTAAVDTTGATMLVLAVAWTTLDMPAVTDSRDNAWRALPTAEGSDGSKLALVVCIAPDVGPDHTFTAQRAGSQPSIAVQAFAGAQGSGPDVNAQIAQDAATTISTGAFVLARPAQIVITATGAKTNGDVFAVDRGWAITDQLPGVAGQSLALGMACRWRPTNSTARNAGHFPTWTGAAAAVREAVSVSFL